MTACAPWGSITRPKRRLSAGAHGTVISASPLFSPSSNVKNVPVVAPSLQPADDPRGGAVFSAGWIKNVGTLLAVQNAYGRDFDVGSLQILDCGFDGLLVRQECRKLIDGSMAELVNVDPRALGYVYSSS